MKQLTRPISTITLPLSRQKLDLHRSTLLDQAHDDILSSQRALSNHRLSSESNNMSRRTTRYMLGKSNNRTYLAAQKQQSHGDADDKAQPPLHIKVPAIKHRSPKYAALQTLNHQCCQTHGQITIHFEINHDVKIYSKTLSELAQFPSISTLLPYIELHFPYTSSFWPLI